MLAKLYKLLIYTISIIVLLPFYNISNAQNINKLDYLTHLNLENGLSHDGATSIIEDSRGLVWIGTYDGLNLYDGYTLKVYKNNRTKSILNSNRILSLCEDKMGRIWIGTEEGITVYDYNKDLFIKLTENEDANLILEGADIINITPSLDKERMICLTENSGILVYNLNYKLERSDIIGGIVSYEMIPFINEKYLITTEKGIMLYNTATGEISQILKDEINYAKSVCITNDKIYFSEKTGIKVIDYSITPLEYKFNLINNSYYNNYSFVSLFIDINNSLWCGSSMDGYIKFENHNQLLEKCKPIINEKSTRISSLLTGSDGRLWITTFDKGVLLYSTNKHEFNYIYSNSDHLFRIWNTTKLNNEELLIKYNNGYIIYNLSTNTYKEDKRYSALINGRSTIAIDSNGDLIAIALGTHSSSFIKYNNGKWNKINLKIKLPNDATPQIITVDNFNSIWVAYNDILYRITTNNNINYDIQEIKLPKNVNKILKLRNIDFDYKNRRAWIGSSNQGLYRIDNFDTTNITQSQITNYYHNPKDSESISSNFVTSAIITDTSLWVGTEAGGLCKASTNNKELRFKILAEKDGLCHNVIKNILPGNNGDLWIATNNGLSHFNIKDETFQNYFTSNGLPFNAFNFHATIFNDSCYIMSGSAGLVTFNPNRIISNKQPIPKIIFDNITISNIIITPNTEYDGRVILKHKLCDGDTLKLKYKDNLFSIKAIPLHYANSKNYEMKYRIIGLNSDWINEYSHNNNITFSGLRPGKYRLEVAAANTNKEWGEPISLNIIITPPFWKTIWAYIIYFILFIAILALIIRTILNMQSLKHKLEIEAINKEDAADKQRYFSNIAHEIKTPLSLVVTASDTLYDRYSFNADISEKLKLVQRQSRKISQMIDTVQSVQLNDLNMLFPKYSTFEFNKLIEAITSDFRYLANKQKKTLIVNGNDTPIYVKADISMIEKVVNNLLNNAHKYSSEGANITLNWSSINNKIIFKVCDNGIGISNDDLPHIFDRFYRGSSQNSKVSLKGSGIGLSFSKQLIEKHNGTIVVESKLNEGSKFTVELPIVTSDIEDNLVLDYSLSDYISNGNIMIGNLNEIIDNENRAFNDSLVYVVEDDDELRKTLEGFLSKFFNVKSFSNGEECLIELENSWPNIILSDVMMPKVDGFELCNSVKSNINTNHIPVILLTACTSIEEKIKCREVGADIYISKPFYPKYVLSCIEAILSNYKKLQEKYQGGEINATQKEDAPIEVNNEKHNEFMSSLYNLINENLDNEDIDFNLFARELCINRTTFFMKVKAITGKTPYELIKDYRLVKSAELLSKGNTTIEEVYSSVGFKSRTHFSKLFKDKYGVPPSKYLKN